MTSAEYAGQADAPRPLWAGRAAVVVGILLLALNLRTAVASISPIVAVVNRDIELGTVGLGLLGTLPPIAFALSGLVAPRVARRLGIETTLVIACCAMVLGPLLRAVSPSYGVLLAGSAVAFLGMGFGNIMLPPVIKKYFPDRIGQLTAAYGTVMALSISVPPLIAPPIASAAGWRVAVGCWALLAVLALVPWLAVRRRARRDDGSAGIADTGHPAVGPLRTAKTAVALAIAFSVTGLNMYALFAWLPELLIQRAGSSPEQAGALLFLFGIVGLPLALVAPILAGRLRNVGALIALGIGLFLVGYLGLLFAPAVATWLWVLCAGTGSIVFPLCLVLIGLRTRGPQGASRVSGFVQGIGYTAAAAGPLLFAVLHEVTGGWTAPLLLLIAVSLVGFIPAMLLRRPSYVEDELARDPG